MKRHHSVVLINLAAGEGWETEYRRNLPFLEGLSRRLSSAMQTNLLWFSPAATTGRPIRGTAGAQALWGLVNPAKSTSTGEGWVEMPYSSSDLSVPRQLASLSTLAMVAPWGLGGAEDDGVNTTTRQAALGGDERRIIKPWLASALRQEYGDQLRSGTASYGGGPITALVRPGSSEERTCLSFFPAERYPGGASSLGGAGDVDVQAPSTDSPGTTCYQDGHRGGERAAMAAEHAVAYGELDRQEGHQCAEAILYFLKKTFSWLQWAFPESTGQYSGGWMDHFSLETTT